MIELQEITIDNKDVLDKYLKNASLINSEFTFTNLFIWRHGYNIRFAETNGNICFVPRHAEGALSCTFPLGSGDKEKSVSEILQYFKNMGEEPLIRIYCEEDAKFLQEKFPGKFCVEEDVDNFDYVYEVEKLITLSGKKLHSKRNHVNKFKSLYDWTYETLSPQNKSECVALYEKWYRSKVGDGNAVNEARRSFFELMENWERLDIIGGCLRVDGEMIAFSFGEKRGSDMVVIHFEQANTDYQGAFPMINQQFLEHEWSQFKYVNREEDMGIEGMRKAKKSYRPVFMVKKYVAHSVHTDTEDLPVIY